MFEKCPEFDIYPTQIMPGGPGTKLILNRIQLEFKLINSFCTKKKESPLFNAGYIQSFKKKESKTSGRQMRGVRKEKKFLEELQIMIFYILMAEIFLIFQI